MDDPKGDGMMFELEDDLPHQEIRQEIRQEMRHPMTISGMCDLMNLPRTISDRANSLCKKVG